MSDTYITTAGTEPSIDEQHEARTLTRGRQEGVYMMTEIGDGIFVQWSNCRTCRKYTDQCTCPDGPAEPDYMQRWRINRFATSFQGRGVEPALPEALANRDRRVNAVTRYLLALGYKIEAPEFKSEIPDFDEADYDVTPVEELAIPDLTEQESSDFMEALGDLHDDDPDRTKDLDGEPIPTRTEEESVVSEKVDAGMDNALEVLRARAQEDQSDVGF